MLVQKELDVIGCICRAAVDNDRDGVNACVKPAADEHAIRKVAYVDLMVSPQNGGCGERLERFALGEMGETTGLEEAGHEVR